MTTRSTGRPAATTDRPARALARACLCVALVLPALAGAAPVEDGAPLPTDRADAQASVAGSQAASAAPKTLSDRALGVAAGVNRLLAPAILPLAMPTGTAEQPLADDAPGKVRTVLDKALALLGTPYRWGGADPDKGFDCSGLVGYVFRSALGIELPRVSRDMARSGELVTDRAQLAAGDLVFFGRRGRVDHVGIYVGEGRFVHAPSRGKDVTVSSLDKGYWSGRFLQARRVTEGG